jgi:GH15 family glucan-1,4-alpha-glucosidase
MSEERTGPAPVGGGGDFRPIERYGLIGDSGAAALVSDDGSIDWLGLPRFDSDPVFARLLDPGGGHFWLHPVEPFEATRRYLADTPVLATTYVTARGRATVYDLFAAWPVPAKRRHLWPFRYLVRRIEGEAGVVRFEAEIAPRDAFGGGRYRLVAGGHRLMAGLGSRAFLAQASSPFRLGRDVARTTAEVAAGERAYLAAAYAARDLAVWPPVAPFAEQVFHDTVAYWRRWARRERLGGRQAEAVRRSAITLKLLTFAPSGGVIAAPTTSLPEAVGAPRNWDYRYVWVRDASWTIDALVDLGYHDEAHAYLFWVTNAARLTQPRVHTMYDLYGSHRVPEAELRHLTGYMGSRPVRRGNAAVLQLQLDNWGHLLEAAFIYADRTGEIDRATWQSLRAFVQFVAQNWRRPDQGMWEVRGPPRHFVHSKVMCWVALDRGVRLVRRFGLQGPADAWERERDRVKQAVLQHGVDPERGNFTRAFGDPSLDASLLQLPIVGFLPGDDRVRRTVDRVRDALGRGELVYRYRGDDGLPGTEGAFMACSFWLAQALAVDGRVDEACEVFERACARANDLGLLPEEIDPEDGRFLGNFPQGLSHIALVNTASTIEKLELGAEPSRQGA